MTAPALVVDQVMARAAELLTVRGWRQGPDVGDERLDASRALSVAAQEIAAGHVGWDWHEAFYAARLEFIRREHIEATGLLGWNDAPGRTVADVTRVLCGGVL